MKDNYGRSGCSIPSGARPVERTLRPLKALTVLVAVANAGTAHTSPLILSLSIAALSRLG